MAQASLELQQFVHRLQALIRSVRKSPSWQRMVRRFEAAKGGLLALAVVVLLLLWNWRLVVSGGMGLSAMLLVYLVQQGQWRLPWKDWRTLLSRSNRPLTLALGSGAIASLSSYLMIEIWQESGGSWLAKGMILQGLGILTLLLLLVWQRVDRTLNRSGENLSESGCQQWLTELSDPDPLKRLIAIRCITQHTTENPSTGNMSPVHLAECFRLMLNRETEPALCRALLESLHILNPTRQLEPGSTPFTVASERRSSRVTTNIEE